MRTKNYVDTQWGKDALSNYLVIRFLAEGTTNLYFTNKRVDDRFKVYFKMTTSGTYDDFFKHITLNLITYVSSCASKYFE
ncbi:MAG: hypothetical protein CM15mV141_250 [uncultured marine virus]|nr:MAG: hypothetical protein CM15mV141_250 [uncultured marine virus]